MGNAFAFGWEDRLILFIQRFMPRGMVGAASVITEFGDEMVLVFIVGLFYWALNKKIGRRLVLCLSFANMVNPCLKSIARRLRPYMVNREIACLKPVNSEGDIYDVVSQEYSFPSGHAVNCVAIYGTLCTETRSRAWRALLVALTLLVGVSRFALGVHYPTDVLAGWLIGLACVLVFGFAEKRLGRKRTFLLVDVIGLAGFLVARTNDYYTGYGMMLGATLGILFEERFVNFAETRKPLRVILRTVVGAGLFLGLNTLLKLPFTEEFLNSGTVASFSVRTVRYAINLFLMLGVYPLAFGRRTAGAPEAEEAPETGE